MLAIVVFFVAQQVVIEFVGEPFPGLTLPSFAPAIRDDVVSTRVPTIEVEFADGDVQQVGMEALVGPTPGRRIEVFDAMFWDGIEREQGQIWRVTDPAAIEWARQRLAELAALGTPFFPTGEPVHLRVTWFRKAFDLDGTPNPEQSKILRVVDVDL